MGKFPYRQSFLAIRDLKYKYFSLDDDGMASGSMIASQEISPSPYTHIFVNTVAQNESLYSKREVEEAKQARELSRMLAFPSFKDISEAISSGTHIDCQVTIQSLRRSTDIYGTPDSILKGKTTHTTTPPDKIITITRRPGNDVHLDGDIFFIEGIAFLLTFSTSVNPLGVTALANRTVTTISKALD